MRAVIQRVSSAQVDIDGETAGSIGHGLLILLGVGHGDGEEQAERLWSKIARLRIFEDADGKTNLSLADVGGEVLVVSQFTLYANCKKAKAWLDAHGVAYADRHIVEDNPTADELAAWHAASGLPLRRFFNASGMVYRERNVKALLGAGMGDEEAYALLAEDGMLVKRPLVVGEGFVLVGFKEAEWEQALLG